MNGLFLTRVAGSCITQFYASKKRKAVSPVSKPLRSEKDARHGVDGSPSAKGTLDSYLVSSQDDCNAARLSNAATAADPLARNNLVKRNLGLDIDGSLDNEPGKLPVSSDQGHQQAQAMRPGLMNELPKASGVVVEDPAQEKGCDFGQGARNSEIKWFAADFLSLYCRYITLTF